MSGTIARTTALFGIAIALLVIFWADVAPGRYLLTYPATRFEPWNSEEPAPGFNPDCIQSYYPRRVASTEALREGRIPLWDPYSFCGQPFLANFQSGVFYPINLLLLPMSPERQLGLFVWIHLVIAGWGTFLMLRSFRYAVGIALIGGLVYATNGALAVRTGQSTMLASAAWFPMVVWLVGRATSSKKIVGLAAGLAMLILSGFPPIVAWGMLLAVTYGVWQSWPELRRGRVVPISIVMLGTLLALGLTAVQLLPTAEFLAFSDRVKFEYATLLSSAWHPATLLRLIVPDYFGTPFSGDDWQYLLKRGDGHYFQSYISTVAYVGLGTLVFAIAGLGRIREKRHLRFFLAVGVAGLLVVLGTPATKLISTLPGLGGSRVDRAVHLVTLSLVVFGAAGLDGLVRRKIRLVVPVVVLIAMAAVVSALGIWGNKIALALGGMPVVDLFDEQLHIRRIHRAAMFIIATGVLFWLIPRFPRKGVLVVAGAITVLDAAQVARPCHVTVSREELPRVTDGLEFLRSKMGQGRVVRFKDPVVPPNLPGVFAVEDVAGYNALTIKYYRFYFKDLSPHAVKERRINPLPALLTTKSPLLHRLAARWIVTSPGGDDPELPLVYDGEFKVYENKRSYPRAWLSADVRAVAGARKAAGILSHPKTERWAVTLEGEPLDLEPDDGSILTVGDLAGRGGVKSSYFPATMALVDTAVITVREPEEVVVECASAGGRILVLSDTWYPGWKAFVDGVETDLHRVNRIFRGVALSAGTHQVAFRYEPASVRNGIVVSLASLAILGFMLFLQLISRRGSLPSK